MEYRDQNRKNVTLDVIITFLLLATGLLLFPLKGVVPSPDSAWYLKNAVKLYNDFCYENLMIRRPLFPFLISLSFHFFGKSIEGAFWVVRVFFVLNIPLSYFVGLKLYNRSTGIAFSLLLLSSFVINQWSSYLLVDGIIPFFILLYILTLHQAFENENRILFGVSGLIIGLAFLVKGVFSILFLALPVCLLVIKRYRTRNQVKRLVYLYGVSIIVLSPWLWHCILNNDFFVLVGPMFKSSEIKASGILPVIGSQGFSFGIFVLDQFRDFINFFNVYINKIFVLAKLFILGFIYVTGHLLFKKNPRGHFYVFFSLILFLPIIYIGMKSGGLNFRNGQFILLYYLLYLMSAFMIVNISRTCSTFFLSGPREKIPGRLLFSVLLMACLFLQIFIGAGDGGRSFDLLKENKVKNFYGFSFWQDDYNSKDGWANETTREAAEWITRHIPKQETLLCQWYYLNMLDYLTDDQYDFQFVEHSFFHENLQKKALFVWPRYNFKVMEGNSLVAIYEENLLNQVNKDRVNYIVVTHRRNFLTLYLQGHPDFELMHSITRGRRNIKIFKTTRFPVSPDPDFIVKFHEKIYNFFQLAVKENKPVFNLQKNEIKQILNWNDEQLASFVLNVSNPDPEMFWQAYEKVKPRTIY